MAKVTGGYFKKGKLDGLQFYEMDGEQFVRLVSSLSATRVKNDPAFLLTMVYAGIMGRASKTASSIYKQLPEEQRLHPFYRILVGMACRLLKNGFTDEEAYDILYTVALGVEEEPVAVPSIELAKPVSKGEVPCEATGEPTAEIVKVDVAFAEEVLKEVFGEVMEKKQKNDTFVYAFAGKGDMGYPELFRR